MASERDERPERRSGYDRRERDLGRKMRFYQGGGDEDRGCDLVGGVRFPKPDPRLRAPVDPPSDVILGHVQDEDGTVRAIRRGFVDPPERVSEREVYRNPGPCSRHGINACVACDDLVCRGSKALGTACGRCSKCRAPEQERCCVCGSTSIKKGRIWSCVGCGAPWLPAAHERVSEASALRDLTEKLLAAYEDERAMPSPMGDALIRSIRRALEDTRGDRDED